MNKDFFDISNLVGEIKNEHEQVNIEKRASAVSDLAAKIAGTELDKTASEANRAALELEQETDKKFELSRELEKVASEMEQSETIDDIIKIAEYYGDSDIGNLAVLARTIADVVVNDISERLINN